MRAIDADAHIDENEQTWEYMDEAERHLKPISFVLPDSEPVGPQDGRRHNLWLIAGEPRLRRFRSDEKSGTTRETRELIDVDARLRHMDQLGIEVQALFPTTFLHSFTTRPEVELALYKSYNRWIADRTKGSHGRLRWIAQAPTLTMDKLPDVLRWAKDHGACAVMKRGVECGYREASDPYFHPLYEVCNELELPICIHQGTGDPQQSNTTDFARMAVLNVLNAFSSLVDGRIPDLFPKVRFGFIEAGASWIPYLIKDLGMRGKAARAGYDFKTEMLAHNRFYVTIDTEDDVASLLNYGAEDYLMLGTDYSHVDQSAELEAHRVLIEQAKGGAFSVSVAEKIVDDNARRFYGL